MTLAADSRMGLLVTVGSRACFVPLTHVIETLRPLPTNAVADMPAFMRGVAVIRGAPVPVVDLALAVGLPASTETTRFLLLRLEHRRVALAVDAVIGVRDLGASNVEAMPPLLSGASSQLIEAIGTLDARLLLVLRATQVVPDALWQRLELAGSAGAAL